MSFITTHFFKAKIAKAELIEFISLAPSELYFFIISSEPVVYGMFVSDEVVEFFTNEFTVQLFEIVSEETISSKLLVKDFKIWGNKELLYIND